MAGYLYKDKPFPGHCLSTSGYPGLPANQDLVMILAQQLQFALQLFCSALLISSLDVKEQSYQQDIGPAYPVYSNYVRNQATVGFLV